MRWFTPTNEVPLCGHATLAAATVLFRVRNLEENTFIYATFDEYIKFLENKQTEKLTSHEINI